MSLTTKSVFYKRKEQYVPMKIFPSSGHGTHLISSHLLYSHGSLPLL